MGIPKYFKYIISNFDNITKNTNDPSILIHHLYFDLNCLIHPCVQDAASNQTLLSDFILEQSSYKYDTDPDYITPFEDKVYHLISNYIEKVISTVNPSISIYISIDGVAPRAKMEQQRSRQYRTVKEYLLKNSILEKYNDKASNFNTNFITPGTIFMYKLNIYLRSYIHKLKLLTNKRIILDDSQRMGEGEHKIFQFIRQNFSVSDLFNEVHCVYGLDADLIMLSLCLTQKIYLIREEVHFNKVNRDNFLYFDVLSFKDQLVDYLTKLIDNESCFDNDSYIIDDDPTDNEKDKSIFPISPQHLIIDYIFISFLLGNDFLPSLFCLNVSKYNIDLLLKSYISIISYRKKHIIENNKINYSILQQLLINLLVKENDIIKSFVYDLEHSRPFLKETNEKERNIEKLKYYPHFHRIVPFDVINDKQWINKYYLYYFNIVNFTKDDNYINSLCKSYIEGLQWTLEYYLEGCPSWSWYYKYRQPPHLRDLSKYLSKRIYSTKFTQDILFSPLEQLAIVLPIQSNYLFCKDYIKFINNNNLFNLYYPIHFELDLAYKYMLHEAPPILPPIDALHIKSVFQTLNLTVFEKQRNDPSNLIII